MIECQYCNTLLKTQRSYEIHLIRDHNLSVEDLKPKGQEGD